MLRGRRVRTPGSVARSRRPVPRTPRGIARLRTPCGFNVPADAHFREVRVRRRCRPGFHPHDPVRRRNHLHAVLPRRWIRVSRLSAGEDPAEACEAKAEPGDGAAGGEKTLTDISRAARITHSIRSVFSRGISESISSRPWNPPGLRVFVGEQEACSKP